MPRKQIPPTRAVATIGPPDLGHCSMLGPRAIWVNSKQPAWEQFSTLHHEWLHRYFPELSERMVRRLEADFAGVVKKFFVVKRRKVARKRRKKA